MGGGGVGGGGTSVGARASKFFFWTCVFFSFCVSVSNPQPRNLRNLRNLRVGYRHTHRHTNMHARTHGNVKAAYTIDPANEFAGSKKWTNTHEPERVPWPKQRNTGYCVAALRYQPYVTPYCTSPTFFVSTSTHLI